MYHGVPAVGKRPFRLFLRQAGAPLDNNLCERALKKAILHRKNALFYRTRNGARVGDLFMSLIYTCQLNRANPFDYLTELQRHADALAACPRALDAVELPRRTARALTIRGRDIKRTRTNGRQCSDVHDAMCHRCADGRQRRDPCAFQPMLMR